jgi:DNA-binding FadR family transcriptional regulator
MMRTDAWKHLDAVAIALYVLVSARYGGPGSNNGKIPYSVREAAKALKVGRTTAAEAFELLQETGLLALETKGTFNRKVRQASEWRLTEFQSDVTSDWATCDYLNWRPVKFRTRASRADRRASQADRASLQGGPRQHKLWLNSPHRASRADHSARFGP